MECRECSPVKFDQSVRHYFEVTLKLLDPYISAQTSSKTLAAKCSYSVTQLRGTKAIVKGYFVFAGTKMISVSLFRRYNERQWRVLCPVTRLCVDKGDIPTPSFDSSSLLIEEI